MKGTRVVRFLGPLVILVLMFGIVACGSDDPDPTATAVPLTIETAASCADLMDLFMPIVQGVLDETKDMTTADMMSDEDPEFLADFEADVDRIREKSDELDCESEELTALFNERKGSLTAEGPVGTMLLEMMNDMQFD